MTGPFKPEDFKDWKSFGCSTAELAEDANALDAARWACEKGGEHEPDILFPWFPDKCTKCGAKLRARWEAVRYDRKNNACL